MGMLGCSRHDAFIGDVCNGPRLMELTDASVINYSRRLDDTSEATVIVPISGSVDDPCCLGLKSIEPFCHILTIIREGDGVVWTGPVTRVRYGTNQVTIEAKDKMAWLQFRVNELSLCYAASCGGVDNMTIPLTEIAEDIMILAMADDDDSPCFLEDAQGNSLIHIVPSTDPTKASDGLPLIFKRTFLFEAFAGPTAYDDVIQLANAGIDFTVFNNNVILMSENLPDRAIGTLTDELILGDVEVIKDGLTMGNRFFVRYDGDDDGPGHCLPQCNAGCACVCPQCVDPITLPCYTVPCPAVSDDTDELCYGLMERVIDGVNATSVDTAKGIANKYLALGKIAPRLIEFPAQTRLSPECTWGINDLICGQRINVALSKLCFPVFQSFKLRGVDVQDDGTDEQISIDLLAVEQTG